MLTAEYDRYGSLDVLNVVDVPEPEPPKAHEIRVRVAAASVNPKDTFVRKGRFRALTGDRFPKRVGYDWAGTVEAVGPAVATFSVGDSAFGMVNGWDGGTCARAINVSAAESARAPAHASPHDAAAIPLAGQTASGRRQLAPRRPERARADVRPPRTCGSSRRGICAAGHPRGSRARRA